MSIRFSKYVRITSGVGGAASVAQRDLIGRIITDNALMSPGEVLEFTDAQSVGEYFGTTSGEYLRSVLYFGYVSPSISAARRISFSRYAPTGTAPAIFGGRTESTLAELIGVTAGVLSLQFNGVTTDITGINFSTALTFADVASLLQTALRADLNPQLVTAVVSFDPVANAFNVMFTEVENVTFNVVQAGVGLSDVGAMLGWYVADGAVYTNGTTAETVSDAFTESMNLSNNFGSFVFLPATPLTLEQHAELAALNAAQGVTYQYMVPVSEANAATWSAALIGFAGTALTLSPISSEFPEIIPMIQLAATDYSRRNATVNYMFKQFPLTPSVTTDALSDSLDALRVNYYGRTQTAGNNIDFYQRGFLMGPVTAPVDMNVYANEQWLKDAASAALMDLLLSQNRVPANAAGRGQILAVVQGAIDQALNNGTISVGKELTTQQKLFVTQQSGDPLAWHQVQDVGYYVDAVIVPYVGSGGATEYKAVYSLLYSKDDAIRFVEGTHSLV